MTPILPLAACMTASLALAAWLGLRVTTDDA